MIKLNNVKDLIKELGIADNEDNIKWAYKMLLTTWKIQSKIDYQQEMLAIENEYLDSCEDDCCVESCECNDDAECCGGSCECTAKECSTESTSK